MLEDRQIRNLSPLTQRSYVGHVVRFALAGIHTGAKGDWTVLSACVLLHVTMIDVTIARER